MNYNFILFCNIYDCVYMRYNEKECIETSIQYEEKNLMQWVPDYNNRSARGTREFRGNGWLF